MEKPEEKTSGGPVEPKKQRIVRVDQIYSRKDRQVHFVETKKPAKVKDKLNKTVLVVRRIISSKGQVAGTEIDIKSPTLKDILAEIFVDVEGLKLNKTPPVADPELLFHACKGLQQHLKKLEAGNQQDDAVINDIGAVFDFVKQDLGDSIENLKSLSEHGDITYQLVWALFPPNILGFTAANTLREPQPFIFKSGTYERDSTGREFFLITGRIIHHDGIDFGYSDLRAEIPSFTGSKKVSSLAAFPLSEHPEEEKLRVQMIERGRKFARFVTLACQEYTGMGVKEEETANGMKEMLFEATGRAVIDPGTFRVYKPNWWNLVTPWVTLTLTATDLQPDQLLICNHRILGFSLTTKEWGAFAISGLRDVIWDENAFTKLIIDPGRRHLIWSLVKSHRSDETGFDDIIQNKGRGLVGLLSGGPGVGKTLTAEVVAELAHKPLYMISAGELGTKLEKIDEQLQMVLDITKRWGCVLLIDEADVFLQKRSDLDMLRNAVVSIFLRRLEYFQGILIMTTNRSNAIDPAFQSRIHFKIQYPGLTEDSRAQVWKDFLSRSPKGIAKPTLSGEDIIQLAKVPLNGREIKNTISCAFSMSRESGKALTLDRVQEVLNILVDDWTLNE